MTCANADQILLSRRVAEDLEQYAQWRPHLHLVGELELKDGRKIPAVNLYSDDFGNAQPPACVKDSVREIPGTAVAEKPARKRRALIYALLLLPVAVGTALSIHRLEREPKPPAEAPFVPEKSIAVLPFDNFSDDNQNAYFADGVQDDILTSLAKVSDLKVISRSSVMQYRGRTKNLREIGQIARSCLRARRQCSALFGQNSHHGAADRCAHGHSHMGRILRSQIVRRFRHPK